MNLFEAKKILGVSDVDTPEIIKKKYRELILKFHPDKVGGDSNEFVKINQAYKIVNEKNDIKFNMFDEVIDIFKVYMKKKEMTTYNYLVVEGAPV